MTRWVPTKREEKYGVGEHLPRAALRAGGAGRGRPGACCRRPGRRGRDAEGPRRPGARVPALPVRGSVGGHCPLGPRAHAVPAPAPEPARAGPGTRGGGGRLVSLPEGVPSDIQLSGGHPGGGAFQPPGLPPTPRPQLGRAGPGREAPGALFGRAFWLFG